MTDASDRFFRDSTGIGSEPPWSMGENDNERRWKFLIGTDSELERARVKFPGEEGTFSDEMWLTVLVEEIGECARAIQDEGADRLRAELVQVAAMAMRWHISTQTRLKAYDPTEVPFA